MERSPFVIVFVLVLCKVFLRGDLCPVKLNQQDVLFIVLFFFFSVALLDFTQPLGMIYEALNSSRLSKNT